MNNWKPQYIQLPLTKMAGCPWNLLDAKGMRIAWCIPGDHERDGEKVANDILNLVAIGQAVGELLEKNQARLAEKDAEIERLKKALDQAIDAGALCVMTVADDDEGIEFIVGQSDAEHFFVGGRVCESPELAQYLQDKEEQDG